jgi:hypothetical protein
VSADEEQELLYHLVAVTFRRKHDLVALGIEGKCDHCLLMLLYTWTAGSGWHVGNAHDRHCNHVPGSENLPSLKRYDMIGSLRCVSWLGRLMNKLCSCAVAKEGCQRNIVCGIS